MAKLSRILVRKAKTTCLFACFLVLYPSAILGDCAKILAKRLSSRSSAECERIALAVALVSGTLLVLTWIALMLLAASRVEAPTNFASFDLALAIEFRLASCVAVFAKAICVVVGSGIVIMYILFATLFQLWLVSPGLISLLIVVGMGCYILA